MASQRNAHHARSEAERVLWLQVAEPWLTMARAENVFHSSAHPPGSVLNWGEPFRFSPERLAEPSPDARREGQLLRFLRH